MKKTLISIEKIFLGKKKFQSIYEMLHRISLRGMYYDQAQSVSASGEIFAMKFAESNLKRKNKIILDIGGNEGEWSKIALEIFSNSTIYIFEPSSKLKSHLDNIFINNDRVNFLPHGLSDTSGSLKLYNSGELIGTSYPKDSAIEYEEINVSTVDQFCYANLIKEIDYMKIDVEGNEYKVLQGSINFLKAKKIKFIQFEFGSNTIVSKVFLKDFISLLSDYHMYRIVKDGLIKFNYNERYEIQLPHNLLAKLKS